MSHAVRGSAGRRPRGGVHRGGPAPGGAGHGVPDRGSCANCLIWGESGTGKNLFAYLIHRLGPRRDGPYVELSCSALPETLVETELFGYARGAFTGAADDHDGRLVKAHGGTLVLDELDCLSPVSQSKLLRVVELGRFTPMGAPAEATLRARYVGVLQESPGELVRRGILRQELYYRLALFTVGLPPLRELAEELPALAEFIARQEADRARVAPVRLGPAALDRLQRYAFPGNLRELQNLVRRWTLLQPGAAIGVDDLPPAVRDQGPGSRAEPGRGRAGPHPAGAPRPRRPDRRSGPRARHPPENPPRETEEIRPAVIDVIANCEFPILIFRIADCGLRIGNPKSAIRNPQFQISNSQFS